MPGGMEVLVLVGILLIFCIPSYLLAKNKGLNVGRAIFWTVIFGPFWWIVLLLQKKKKTV